MRYPTRLILTCLTIFAFCTQAFAERPTAPQLFPDTTLAYLRVDDVQQLQTQWNKTSTGQLMSDPQISPLFQEIYSSLIEAAKNFEEEVGLTINEVLQIPQGELAIAVIPTEESPAVCVLIEARDRMPELEILLARATRNRSEGVKKEKVSFLEISNATPNLGWNRDSAYFIDQGVFVFSNNVDILRQVAAVWTDNSIGHKSLASKSDFVTILSRCTGTAGERPQISFYVDPLSIAKEASKQNAGATAVFAMLPPLGIDGIKGIGGSVILAPEDFDSIAHFHLLLGSPRRGVLSVVRPKEGPIDPETWVSEEVGTYMTINWRTQPTIAAIQSLVDTFQGPDAFKTNVIDTASKQLKLDFEKDVLEQIDDRISMAQVFLRPAKVNAGSNVFAVRLKNSAKFEQDTVPKIFAVLKQNDKRWEQVKIGDHDVYHLKMSQNNDGPRVPDPAIVFLDDRILISDALRSLELVCQTYDSGSGLMLDSLEYKVIKQRIESQVEGMNICGLTMSRPEESLRVFYDMAADPSNRDRLAEMAESNPVLSALNNALQKHQLPPFDVIRKHLAPSGGFVSEDDTGLHYTSFSIRRN